MDDIPLLADWLATMPPPILKPKHGKTPAQAKLIEDLWRAGKTIKEIIFETGLTYVQVRYTIRKMN